MVQYREEEPERIKLHELEKVATKIAKEGRRQLQLSSNALEKYIA